MSFFQTPPGLKSRLPYPRRPANHSECRQNSDCGCCSRTPCCRQLRLFRCVSSAQSVHVERTEQAEKSVHSAERPAEPDAPDAEFPCQDSPRPLPSCHRLQRLLPTADRCQFAWNPENFLLRPKPSCVSLAVL